MKYGKLTQTAWQRSVRRQLDIEEQGTLFGLSPFEGCSGLNRGDIPAGDGAGRSFVWADAHTWGTSPRTGYYAVLRAAGELAAKGARPAAVSVHLLLPVETQEEELKELTAGIQAACRRMKLPVSAFQGETTSSVARPVVSVTAVGEADCVTADCAVADYAAARRQKCGEQEILLCGYAGLEGTLRILDEAEDELGTRFVSSFLARAKDLTGDLVTPEQILSLRGSRGPRAAAVRQITGGGILAALWELAETLGTGFEIDLSEISLRQETVEICEFYRLNPYQMTSAGSFLVVTKDGQEAIDVLEKAGARAVRLGVTKEQNARVITSGEEVRYLDRPAPDELEVWMAERSDRTARSGRTVRIDQETIV